MSSCVCCFDRKRNDVSDATDRFVMSGCLVFAKTLFRFVEAKPAHRRTEGRGPAPPVASLLH